jgi:hypothetical protein
VKWRQAQPITAAAAARAARGPQHNTLTHADDSQPRHPEVASAAKSDQRVADHARGGPGHVSSGGPVRLDGPVGGGAGELEAAQHARDRQPAQLQTRVGMHPYEHLQSRVA